MGWDGGRCRSGFRVRSPRRLAMTPVLLVAPRTPGFGQGRTSSERMLVSSRYFIRWQPAAQVTHRATDESLHRSSQQCIGFGQFRRMASRRSNHPARGIAHRATAHNRPPTIGRLPVCPVGKWWLVDPPHLVNNGGQLIPGFGNGYHVELQNGYLDGHVYYRHPCGQ